jgi:ferredoxin--NADP+ reductase
MRAVSFVSREAAEGALPGRVPAAIEDGRLESVTGVALSAEKSQVMICGNPEMVKDTSAALARRGMKKHRRRDPGQITVENYW